ncbi:hypothetical protein SIO70_26605 [Chitinophaga sancti]|uniref:hypothetical protein n=1 Tax=Chitinophaga sancti TaxID=1004 RepID=UPI002A753A9F|nr:hypothetical protein [Chitinophaga sancti]WPQ61938.1 hypothetical protein SIO70_26605 [Chitinophaga sancti]
MDRVLDDIMKWNEHEKTLRSLYPDQKKKIASEKLTFYEELSAKYNKLPLSDFEKSTFKSADLDRRKLIKDIYPWPLNIVRNLLTPQLQKMIDQKNELRDQNNFKDVRNELTRLNLGDYIKDLPRHYNKNSEAVTVPIGVYTNELNYIEIEVKFKKDQLQKFHLEALNVSIKNPNGKVIGSRDFIDVAKTDRLFTVLEMGNLVIGRPIGRDEYSEGKIQTSYFVLDPNDRDIDQNRKLKEHQPTPAFNIEDIIAKIDFKDKNVPGFRKNIACDIKSGNLVNAEVMVNGESKPFTMVLNLQRKDIIFIDKSGEKFTSEDVKNGKSKDQAERVVKNPKTKITQSVNNSKKNGIKLEKDGPAPINNRKTKAKGI